MEIGIKTILYIVLGLIYLIYNIRKSMKKHAPKPVEKTRSQNPPEKHYLDDVEEDGEGSFRREAARQPGRESPQRSALDDLLEEFMPTEKPEPARQPAAYRPEPAEDLEAFEPVQAAEKEAAHPEHFEPYDHKHVEHRFGPNYWKKKLSSPAGAREAFIASEIFNKKY